MSTIHASDMFGYHSHNQLWNKFEILIPADQKYKSESFANAKKFTRFANYIKSALHVAGYIPIIGTIVAIAKLIFMEVARKKLFNEEKGFPEFTHLGKKVIEGMKIRSAIELTSLGFVLIIPDLMYTIERNINKHYEEQLA